MRRQEQWILRGVDWRIPQGSCAAILGPNGSGKSTLARIVAAHLWPTTGDVYVLGEHFGESSLPKLREQIRLVQPAGPYDIDPELTALEVALSGYFGTLNLYDPVTDEMRNHATALLQQVGLSRVIDHRYATLSSGERVRSLIARALVVRPKLLLLDEPTAGLDLLAREQVLAAVQQMFAADRTPPPTVIIITHHVEELPPATSGVLLLSEGTVAAKGAPAEVLRSDVLSRAYGCEVDVRLENGRCSLHVNPRYWDQLL